MGKQSSRTSVAGAHERKALTQWIRSNQANWTQLLWEIKECVIGSNKSKINSIVFEK